MIHRTLITTVFLMLLSSIAVAGGFSRIMPVPSQPVKRDAAISARLLAKDEAAESMPPLKPCGIISRDTISLLTSGRDWTLTELPLEQWTTNGAEPDFALPQFSRNEKGHLQTKPNPQHPDNTFGFWSSPSFTIEKPSGFHDANSLTAYVEYTYTGVSGGCKIPSARLRFNRTDFQECLLYLLDGRNLHPGGGSGTLTCKFDTNILTADAAYILSVDFISLASPVDPNFTLSVTRAYLIKYEEPTPSDYVVQGVWVEDDRDAKAWINGYRIKLDEDCYDTAFNNNIAAVVVIINSYWDEYDLNVWTNDNYFWLNANDTYQTAVAGNCVAYLEQDCDVKVWKRETDELIKIKDDGYRISSGGGDTLLIWDTDDDLYIWHPTAGLYKVDKDDIWFLCNTTTSPVPLHSY